MNFMLLKANEIKKCQRLIKALSKKFQKKLEIYDLLSEPTRLKILLLLARCRELCPTDLSKILGVSLSSISHQLRILELSGLTQKTKKGKMICYKPSREGENVVRQLKAGATTSL